MISAEVRNEWRHKTFNFFLLVVVVVVIFPFVVVALVSHAFFAFELSGLFFLGAAGVVYAIFLYGDLLKDVPGCRGCPPALGGAEVREPADLETN